MHKDGGKTPRFDWILDTLASRVGMFAVVGFLLSVCVGVGHHLQTVVTQLEENHSIFDERQTRNGYVAMSDIQRLILVVQSALEAGEMTPALINDFQIANDMLYVRTENFERMMHREDTQLASGAASIAALRDLVDIADDALSEGFTDVRVLLDDLLVANTKARANLVQFLDDMRREADRVLEKQSRAVRKQQIVVIANLLGLSFVGGLALFFLRREVLTRQAREKAEKRVEFLAYFDPLTHLPNRTQFQDDLRKGLQKKKTLALVYLDLDDFKAINDTHGHAAGDAVLCHVARVLAVASNDLNGKAARLAGDEFALIIPSDDIDTLKALCDHVISAMAEPHWFEGNSFAIGISMGLATTRQLNSTGVATTENLSRAADFALYTSKETGRNRFTVYDHVIEKRFLERRALIEELPLAIENEDLDVHLQPKVTLPDGHVYGFEALVRWRRNGQLVPPSEFIAIAEECGLIVEIDHFVLKRGTQIVADWNRNHATNFSLSVNLSTLNFNSSLIGIWVEQALWNAMMPSELLTLEVTETMEMRDWKKAKRIIDDLKEAGCKIAIDDFGTGFSSLAYLRAMKAHELKIDRSLLTGLEHSAEARLLLRSVLEMAHNLHLCVTIEGIETEWQAQLVCDMGAENAQGFWYGRPVSPDEALKNAMTANSRIEPCRTSGRSIGSN